MLVTLYLLKSSAGNLCKQFGPRSRLKMFDLKFDTMICYKNTDCIYFHFTSFKYDLTDFYTLWWCLAKLTGNTLKNIIEYGSGWLGADFASCRVCRSRSSWLGAEIDRGKMSSFRAFTGREEEFYSPTKVIQVGR